MSLATMWADVKDLNAGLDKIERVARKLEQRRPEGRVTPFFATKRFVFGKSDFVMQSSPLVHDAGRVTRVVRLTYSVHVELPTLDAFAITQNTFAAYEMRPTARGMTRAAPVGLRNAYDDDDVQVEFASSVFDFEWAFSIGSTERNYAQRIGNVGAANTGNTGGVFMSRNALGNPENDKSLLFSEKHPIVLPTNEFLTFKVRPIFSYLATPGANSFGEDADEAGGRFVVNINYAGYRTFGYGEGT